MLKLEKLGHDGTVQLMLDAAKRCLEVWQRLVHITGGGGGDNQEQLYPDGLEIESMEEQLCDINDAPGTIASGPRNIKVCRSN